MWKVCNVKKKSINQKSWLVVNSRIFLLLSTTLLCKQRGEWESKENFFSFQVSDKEKKKYSPSIDFNATVVSTRDGFQNFQDGRFKIDSSPTSSSINRVTSLFIRQSAKEARELEEVKKDKAWDSEKLRV